MYAIIETGGKQYRVASGDVLDIERIIPEDGQTISFTRVLAIGEGEQLNVGSPLVEGAQVQAELITQRRAKKIHVFKMKRRKSYRRRQGHRQEMTRVRITDISSPE